MRNDLICGVAAHIDFGSAIDTGGGLLLSALHQADDTLGETERRFFAKVLARVQGCSATAAGTVEVLAFNPKGPGSSASWTFQPGIHGPHGGSEDRMTAVEQLIDGAFDETGDERLGPGQRIVSTSRKGLDPLVGEELLHQRL